jgi:methyl-accepting chemotaxis protein
MNPFFKRFFGVSFILFAVIGILISLGGVYGIWWVRSVTLNKFSETSQLVDDTLVATYDGLGAVDTMLAEVMETIDSSQNVLVAMSETMADINAFSSGFLSRLRLFMPGLNQEEDPQEDTTNNMEVFQTELENIADNFLQVNGAMLDTRAVMGNYQQAVAETRQELQELQTSAPRGINTLTWILTVLLLWFAITQAGFIIQGVEFIRAAKEARAEILEDSLIET